MERAAKYLGISLPLFSCVDLSLTSQAGFPEDDITLTVQFDHGLCDWTQAETAISKPAETIQNTRGPLKAPDNEFHGSVGLYVWETRSLAK